MATEEWGKEVIHVEGSLAAYRAFGAGPLSRDLPRPDKLAHQGRHVLRTPSQQDVESLRLFVDEIS